MDRVFNTKKSFTIFALIAGLAIVLVSSISYLVGASTPDAGGKINACYRTNGGDLRIIDTANPLDTCSNKETALSWEQKDLVPSSMGRMNGNELVVSELKNVKRWSVGTEFAESVNNGSRGYCLEVPFTPYVVSATDNGGGSAMGEVVIKYSEGSLYDTYWAYNGTESVCPDANYNVFLKTASNYAFVIN